MSVLNVSIDRTLTEWTQALSAPTWGIALFLVSCEQHPQNLLSTSNTTPRDNYILLSISSRTYVLEYQEKSRIF